MDDAEQTSSFISLFLMVRFLDFVCILPTGSRECLRKRFLRLEKQPGRMTRRVKCAAPASILQEMPCFSFMPHVNAWKKLANLESLRGKIEIACSPAFSRFEYDQTNAEIENDNLHHENRAKDHFPEITL
jgi:hypothetical protein